MRLRWRSIVLNIVALSFGLLLAFVLAEAALRLFGLSAPGGARTVSKQNFACVPGIYDPNQDEVDRRIPTLSFRVRINNLGYRGEDFPLAKPEGKLRIKMVGDSFTFGDFVDDSETLPAQLQALLRCPMPTRVINAGMGGTSISTQRHLIERGLVLSPDLVILTFYENDIADLERPHWELLAENRGARARFPLSVVYPLVPELALWRLAQETRERWRNRDRLDSSGPDDSAPTEDGAFAHRRERLRADYARRLEELIALLDDSNTRFVLATYPSHLTLRTGERSDTLVWVENLGRELGVDVVSLWEPLAESGFTPEDLYLLPHDGHPRPRAHSIAAAHLANELRSGAIQDLCPL